jgi:hypothetical protein
MNTAKLVVNGVELHLGSEVLANIIDFCLPTGEDAAKIIGALAIFPNSARVMVAMATRKDLSPDAARDLAKDRNYAVIDALINNKKVCRYIPANRIYEILESGDIEMVLTIFRNVENLPQVNYEYIVSFMVQHSDPALRHAIANCTNTQFGLLTNLKHDDDPEVRDAAYASLLEISEEPL